MAEWETRRQTVRRRDSSSLPFNTTSGHLTHLHFGKIFILPPREERNVVMRVSVCLSVCVCVYVCLYCTFIRLHTSQKPHVQTLWMTPCFHVLINLMDPITACRYRRSIILLQFDIGCSLYWTTACTKARWIFFMQGAKYVMHYWLV